MAPLPSYRLDVAPPFTDTGVDLFGPVSVKSGRYGKKVWVVLFCCLRVRAVYMDVVSDIEAQTFIEVLKRFHSFYPSVRRLHSDQGTNLIGADNMLKKMLAEWKNLRHRKRIRCHLGLIGTSSRLMRRIKEEAGRAS